MKAEYIKSISKFAGKVVAAKPQKMQKVRELVVFFNTCIYEETASYSKKSTITIIPWIFWSRSSSETRDLSSFFPILVSHNSTSSFKEQTFPVGLKYKTLFNVRGSSTALIVKAATSLSCINTPAIENNSPISKNLKNNNDLWFLTKYIDLLFRHHRIWWLCPLEDLLSQVEQEKEAKLS